MSADGDTASPQGPAVLIVGAGFGGLGCAKELAKHRDVRVTLIDKHNSHQFQPLLEGPAGRRSSSPRDESAVATGFILIG